MAFGLQNTNVTYNVLYLLYFKRCGYIGCPKKRYHRPTNSKAEKRAKTPAIPHPEQSPGQPRPRDRDCPNWVRHTSPSAALTHQLTPPTRTVPTPKPKPAKAPPRTREPRFNKSAPLCHRSNASRPLQGHLAHQSSP